MGESSLQLLTDFLLHVLLIIKMKAKNFQKISWGWRFIGLFFHKCYYLFFIFYFILFLYNNQQPQQHQIL